MVPIIPAEPRKPETLTEKYARHTRNAVVFIAVIVGVIVILSFVGVIITGVELAHIQDAYNNAANSITNTTP